MSSAPQPRPEVWSNIRIVRAGHIADIFLSKAPFGEIYHYVIQREGSPEIVSWGQEKSLQGAKECVESYLGEQEQRQAG